MTAPLHPIKQRNISLRILRARQELAHARGCDMDDPTVAREAIDAVLGAGTVDRIAGEVYDELRIRAAR